MQHKTNVGSKCPHDKKQKKEVLREKKEEEEEGRIIHTHNVRTLKTTVVVHHQPIHFLFNDVNSISVFSKVGGLKWLRTHGLERKR